MYPAIVIAALVAGVSGAEHADAWASAVSTLLLIILTVLQYKLKVSNEETKRAVAAVHEDVTHGANAAASAAEAAAESARVIKDIGGMVRDAKAVALVPIPDDPAISRAKGV